MKNIIVQSDEMKGLKSGMFLLSMGLLSMMFVLLWHGTVFAEGSWQVGLSQGTAHEQKLRDYVKSLNRPIYVDILNPNEVINIHVCGNNDTDDIDVKIYNSSGTQVLSTTIDASSDPGFISQNNNFNNLLNNPPLQYTALTAGTYEIRFENKNDSDRRLKRFDITVTGSTVTDPAGTISTYPPDPRLNLGRVWSRYWSFVTDDGSYTETTSTDADFYAVVDSGFATLSHIWKLDLNKLAGNSYKIVANDIGVNSPYSGLSVPATGKSVQPLYPIYLSYPEKSITLAPGDEECKANPGMANCPTIQNARFIDSADKDSSFSPPPNTNGTQDTGKFEFDTNLTSTGGIYSIIIDINGGGYGGGDVLLMGRIPVPPGPPQHNVITWDGKDNKGVSVPKGKYKARLEVRTGEFHYVAEDVEVSGGFSPTDHGLTMYRMTSESNQVAVPVLWNDMYDYNNDGDYTDPIPSPFPTPGGSSAYDINGTTTLPDGSIGAYHTWTYASKIGEENFIDTYSYGAKAVVLDIEVIISDGSDDNLPPVANNDSTGTEMNTPVPINILDNDTDPDSPLNSIDPTTVDLDPLTAGKQTSRTVSGKGTFTVNASGVVTFTPVTGFTDDFVEITYTVSDTYTPSETSNAAKIRVNVGNLPPLANNDSVSATVGTPITFSVLGNDSDPDGTLAANTTTNLSSPGGGTLVNNGNGTFTYTPSVAGPFSFTYTVKDDEGLDSNLATVNISVAAIPVPVNNPPTANPDSANTKAATPVTLNIVGNDSDSDGSVIPSTVDLDPNTAGIQNSYTVSGQGTFTTDGSGNVTFTPLPTFSGTATIPYTINDDDGAPSNQANISVTVAPNQPPVAANDSAETLSNTPVTLTVVSNDTDPDGSINAAEVDLDPATPGIQNTYTKAGEGTFTVNASGVVTFTPANNFSGISTIPYTVNDNLGKTSNPATISITVVNRPPVANNDIATTTSGTSVTVNVVENDSDPDGTIDPATVDLDPNTPGIQHTITIPDQGTFTADFSGNVTFVFTPLPTFEGIASASYVVNDDKGVTSNPASITIRVTNSPPVAKDDSETTPWNTPVKLTVVSNDTDPDNNLDIATVDLDPSTDGIQTTFTKAGEGTFTVNALGEVTFTPIPSFAGISTIPYLVSDQVKAESNIANISVTVENAPPNAEDDSAATPPNTPVSIPVLSNDSDPNHDPLTIDSIVTQPENGTVTFTPDGTVIYTPNPGFFGTDTFVYQISDGQGGTDTATVTIRVDSNTPTAVSDSAVTPPDTPVSISVLSNDSDPDGDPLTVTGITKPGNGTVIINSDGTVTYTPNPGFTGTDTFTYTITDPDGNTDTAIVTVVIAPEIPYCLDDTATTPTDSPVTLPVLNNDTDPDGDSLTVTHITQPANGIAVLNADGTVTYTPNPGFSGVETFTYTACDNDGNCDIASVTITVENAPPNAEDDSTATPPNTPVSIPVLTNDSDPNHDPLIIDSIVTQPVNGTVTFTEDGTVIYTPNPGFTGSDTFVYQISDGQGGTDTATVTIVVDNDSPTAVSDSAVTPPDTPVSIGVLANDSDPDSDPLTVTGVTTPSNGTILINADGTVTYTPNPGFIGTDTFVYTITDPDGNADTAIVTVVINPKVPDAVDDTGRTPTNTPITVPILANDSDPNGDPLTVSHITQPANGIAILNLDGTVTYTPNPGFSGVETFTYTVCDHNGNCDIASVTITVENAPPNAEDDSTATPPNTPVSIPILTNDSDPNGDMLTVERIVTQPLNGTVSITPEGTVIYTPKGNFTGTDTFVYEISDGKGGTDTATVTIVVDNDSPTAVADSAVTPPNTPIDIAVVANDSDPDNAPLTVTEITIPANGAVKNNSDGTVTYTPNPGFIGTDTFSYTIENPDGNTDTAIVTVVVNPKTPDAVDDTGKTPTDTPVTVPILANDTDPNGDPLTVSHITQPANGVAVLNPNGTVTYTPNTGFRGVETFTYTICDDNDNCDIASVTILVENAPPVAEDDSASTPKNTRVSIPVLTNDSDPNHDPLIVEKIVTPPTNGTLSFTSDGTMIYTPNPGFSGTDSFVYQINDGHGGTDTATVTVKVNDDSPTAVADSAVTMPDSPVSIRVLANDSDPEGDPMTLTDVTKPAHGTVVTNSDGTITYTPEPNFVGTDTFFYTVTDPDNNSDTAIVTVVVNPKTPNAVDDTRRTPTDTPVTIPVLATDSDPDSDPLTVSHITQPANGKAVLNPDGTVTYTPNFGFSGTDTFTYTVCDDNGNCDIASVTITVENAPPNAEDDSASTPVNTPVSVPVLTNDSDPNHDPLIVEKIVAKPANGKISFTSDGEMIYTPNPGFSGADTFVYQISDGKGGTDTATVTIVVNNASPTATADSVVTSPDEPVHIDILNNDTDPDHDLLTVSDIRDPAHGIVVSNDDGTVTYTPNPGFVGIDTFVYTVTDSAGNSDTAIVSVVVNPRIPFAEDDVGITPYLTPVTTPVLANDNDPEGNPLTVSSITQPANGRTVLNEDGTVTYTPNIGFSGSDTYTYTVCNPSDQCDIASVTITVENAPPIAEDDSASTLPNTPVSVPILVNDSDPNNDPLVVDEITTFPANGTVSFTPDGMLIYTPNPGFSGTDTFVYRISDGKGGTDSATVTIKVDNDSPTAVSDSVVTRPEQPVNIYVLANDSDPNQDPLTITDTTEPSHGTVVINSDGTVTYRPEPGFIGTDSFTYTVSDPDGNSDTATVSVRIMPQTPEALDDTGKTPTDTPVTVDILANDRDPDGEILTVTAITQPANGNVILNEDGTVTYTPNPGFSGTDTFTYTVCDPGNHCDMAAVTIAVENAPPVAIDDKTSTRPNQSVSIPVLTNDSDPNGDPLTIEGIVTKPKHGTVSFTPDGTVIYTPKPGFTGIDTFVYEISDGNGGTDTATVRVTVDNETPAAVADSVVTRPEQPVTINVLSNDTDPEGDPLKVTRITTPNNGTVVKNEDGTLTYTPNPGFIGSDTFTYTVKDPSGNTNSATVTVVVDPYTPNAVDNAESTEPDKPITIEVVSDDNDPNGDTLTITQISQPGNGKVTDNGDGTLTYKPNPGFSGTDTFTYTVCDKGSHCDIAAVTVTVENAPPIAEDDSSSTRPNQPVSVPVLINDSDPNGDVLIVRSIPTLPQNGTVTFTPDGTVIYTPNPGFSGKDTFVYEISDGHGGTDTATVTITVDDYSPAAVSESAVTKPKQSVIIDVLANDSDPDGDPLTISHIKDPEHGSVIVNKDGTVTYTPDKGFLGTDTFTYTVKDPDGHTDTATVRVEVDPYIPDALDNVDKTEAGKPISIDILRDDSDPNGDALSLTHISQPANGTVREDEDGTLTYSPNPGFSGTDTFTYTVCDVTNRCDVATVTVFVENAPPIAENDSVSTLPGEAVSVPVLVNDSDPNGDSIAIEDIVTQPKNGTVTITEDGEVIYTPNPGFSGTDTFEYRISDGKGGTDTALVTVIVDNLTPATINDKASTPVNMPVQIAVLENDSDPNGDPLTVSDISLLPANGTVSINPDGTLSYTPKEGFVGTDIFEYLINDGNGGTASAFVTIEVFDNRPVALADKAVTDSLTSVVIDVLANDSDPNDEILTVTALTKPAHGKVELNNDGTVTYTANPGFSGTDVFTYTVCNESGNCDTETVTVIVENLPPDARDDSAATRPGTPVSVPVLTNDSDPEGQLLTITLIGAMPENGSITIAEDGTITYTPNPGFTGTDTFDYTISDGQGGTDTATVTIRVDNETPTAVSDHAVIRAEQSVTIPILANDSDPENDPLTVTDITKPLHGKITQDDKGQISYTPNPGFVGTDTFVYTICDDKGACDTASVSITVKNLPPQAEDDMVMTLPDTPVNIAVLSNDGDPDGDPLTVTSVGAGIAPTQGKVMIAADGQVIYTPNPGAVGTDIFDYTVSDGFGGTATAMVTVVIPDNGPVALPDTALSDAEKPVTINVLQNDGDPDGNPLTITAVTKPANGTVAIDNSGTPDDPSDDRVIYMPKPGFIGIDSFDYTISDGLGGTATASVTVTVIPPAETILVSGRVFNDLNKDGIQNPDEPGLEGVRVILSDSTGQTLESLSDKEGFYVFREVISGSYTLTEINPEGFESSTPDMLIVSGYQSFFNFGDYLRPTVPDTDNETENEKTVGTITGSVWNDVNNDGIRNPDEENMSGVTVNLRDAASNTVTASADSDEKGYYRFDDLPPGEYLVEFVPPSGYELSPSPSENDVLTISQDSPNIRADAGISRVSPDLGNTVLAVRDINGEDLEPGDILWYQAVIYNSGTGPASGVVYTDIPESYTHVVNASVKTSQGSVIGGNKEGDTMIGVDIGTIQPGESVVITYLLQVNSDAPEGSLIKGQGQVGSKELPDESTDNLNTAAINDPTVVGVIGNSDTSANANISAVKTAADLNAGKAEPGDKIRYRVTVTNEGPDTAKNLIFSDSAPLYTRLVSGSVKSDRGNVEEGALFNVFVGDLAPGESVTIEFEVTIDADAPPNAAIAGQGIVTGDGNIIVFTDDPLTPEPEDSTLMLAAGMPYIEVYKTVSDLNSGSVNPGDILEYEITVMNTGLGTVGGVVFYDKPQGHISLIPGTVSTGKGSVIRGDTEVEVNIGALGPEEKVIIRFQVLLEKGTPEGTRVPNQGRAEFLIPDSETKGSEYSDDPSTAGLDDPTIVIAVTDPYVVDPPSAYKKATGEGVNVIYWEMLWVNDKNTDAMLVHLEDVLPEGLIFIEDSIGADYGEYHYDSESRKIIWEGRIPGNGGEVHIWYHTQVPDDMNRVENQACGIWDRNGNGDWKDEDASELSDIRVCTDDPETSDNSDPTVWTRVCDFSIGDRVWNDSNADGYLSEGEIGIDGVRVNLYSDSDGSGDYTHDTDVFAATMTSFTSDEIAGNYLFSNLCAGDYIVQIAPENFGPGMVLDGYMSSPGDSDPDNGIDNDDNGYVMSGYGAVSKAVTANKDFTDDFGLYSCSLSLSAMIWDDINRDGIRQSDSEKAIAGVTVNLWTDKDGSGDYTPGTDEHIGTVSELSGSDIYVFEHLCPGDYLIRIAPENFDSGAVLDAYIPVMALLSPVISLPGDIPVMNFNFYKETQAVMKPF